MKEAILLVEVCEVISGAWTVVEAVAATKEVVAAIDEYILGLKN